MKRRRSARVSLFALEPLEPRIAPAALLTGHDVKVVEGNSGTKTANFLVQLPRQDQLYNFALKHDYRADLSHRRFSPGLEL
jgi:hypothetical protein